VAASYNNLGAFRAEREGGTDDRAAQGGGATPKRPRKQQQSAETQGKTQVSFVRPLKEIDLDFQNRQKRRET
jgi:hypothetical protein